MSGTVGGPLAIPMYLAITKDEQSYVTKGMKADPQTQSQVKAFLKQAPTITSSSQLLKSYQSLQVLLGAFNMGSDIGATGILKDLLTQDPTSSSSLVQQTANTNYLHFVKATTTRSTVDLALGNPQNLSLVTGGDAASTFTLQNAAYAESAADQTSSNIGKQWQFVLNDGSAQGSILSALDSAAGGGASYSINPDGSVSGSAGSPSVTVTTQSDGSKVYSLALATDSSGNVTSEVNVVSVPVTAGTTAGQVGSQVKSLVGAMQAAGFDAQQNADGSISIIDGIATSDTTLDKTGITAYATTATQATSTSSSMVALGAGAAGLKAGETLMDGTTVIGQIQSVDASGNVTLTGNAMASIAIGDALTVTAGTSVQATAMAATTTSQNVVSLGSAAAGLVAGQVLRDGSQIVGTIQSIDPWGNVTLTANAQVPVAIGDTIAVAPGVSMSNVGIAMTATGATTTSGNMLSLGSAATGLQAGQVIMDGSTVIGTVKSVDGLGDVTLTGNAQAAVATGDRLTVTAGVTSTTTPALSDAQNLQSIVNQYETSQFEKNEGQQIDGMQQALYFTRNIGSVTTIQQLMSDPTLLSVVTANLGLPQQFGLLNYDQQVRILTKDVKLSDFQNAKYVTQSAERYLTLVQINQSSTPDPGSAVSLFGDAPDPGQTILSILGGGSTSSSSLPATSGASINVGLSLLI